MNDLYESYNYDVSYRAILNSSNVVKVVTDKDFIEVHSQISFDIDYSSKTSFNYFAASIISGIIHNLISCAKVQNLDLQDIEGKIKLNLKNPLTILKVRGYDQTPKIESCDILIYLYSEIDDKKLLSFCKKSLEYCFIYNTLKNSMDINVNFIPIL